MTSSTVQAPTYLRASQDPALLVYYRNLLEQAGILVPIAADGDGPLPVDLCHRCGLEIVGARIEEGFNKFHNKSYRLFQDGI